MPTRNQSCGKRFHIMTSSNLNPTEIFWEPLSDGLSFVSVFAYLINAKFLSCKYDIWTICATHCNFSIMLYLIIVWLFALTTRTCYLQCNGLMKLDTLQWIDNKCDDGDILGNKVNAPYQLTSKVSSPIVYFKWVSMNRIATQKSQYYLTS